jgi:hypothetical protein
MVDFSPRGVETPEAASWSLVMRIVLAFLSLCMAAMVALGSDAGAQAAEGEIAAGVENRSEPGRCAEKDNVYLPFHSPRVRSFRIEVAHPAYVGTIATDRSAPDWTSCDTWRGPSFTAKPRRVTFHETPGLWLVGHTYATDWRPNTVPTRVGDRIEEGFHLVQVWMLHQGQARNVLAVYPQDGYWRARPLPPAHLRDSAYGSSFLIGPVEIQERPFVALREITFEPTTNTFRLRFVRGGSATLKLDDISQERMILDVAFDDQIPTDKPFAALRSMYVTEFNSDAARVAWLTRDGNGWNEAPIMPFAGASAVAFWLGRTAPSRHNLSAPDMVFSHFRDGTLAHGSFTDSSSLSGSPGQ